MSCFTSGRWLLSQLCIIALVTGLCAALGRGIPHGCTRAGSADRALSRGPWTRPDQVRSSLQLPGSKDSTRAPCPTPSGMASTPGPTEASGLLYPRFALQSPAQPSLAKPRSLYQKTTKAALLLHRRPSSPGPPRGGKAKVSLPSAHSHRARGRRTPASQGLRKLDLPQPPKRCNRIWKEGLSSLQGNHCV